MSARQPSADTIGVGLVGAGAFGRRLALATRSVQGLRLVALHDSDPGTAAAAAAQLGIPAVPELAQLIEHREVAAVIVATSHATHVPIGLMAAAAGRHLFIEKPLAITVAEGKRLIDEAERARVTLLVGHVTRLLPTVRQAFGLLDAGRIGEPYAAWMIRHQPARRLGWFARRADFGMLLHSPAVHNLDLLNRILGRATSVTALAARSIQVDVEYPDVVGVLVGYEGGRVGSLGATVSDPLFRPGGTSSARIIGANGGLAFDIVTGRIDLQPADGLPERIDVEVEDWGVDGAVVEELTNFASVIRGEAEPFVRPDEALRAVELCEAADRSIETGAVVMLPLTNVPAAYR